MTVAVLLVVLTLAVTVAGLRWLRAGSETGVDAHAATVIAIALLATDFVIRPLELAFGFDSPFPDVVFAGQETAGAMVKAQLLAAVWIAVFAAASRFTQRRGTDPKLLSARWLPSDAAIVSFVPVLALIAVGANVVVWLRFGIGDLARVVKSSDTPVPSFLRSPAILSAYLGVAIATFGQRRGHRRMIGVGVVAFVVGAGLAFSWGARDAALLPLVIVLGAVVEHARRQTDWAARLRVWGAVGALAVLVLGAGLALRATRELVAYGRIIDTTTEGSVVRRLAVTTNHTRYDAVLLLFEETEPTPERPGLGIFADAGLLAISGGSTEGSDLVVPALAVRRTVQPQSRNGWPITAPGDWYFAGGWLAVPLGAAVSGVVFGVVDRWRRRQVEDAWIASTAVVAIFATTVTWGGLGVTTPTRFRSLLVIGLVLLALWPRVAPMIGSCLQRARSSS